MTNTNRRKTLTRSEYAPSGTRPSKPTNAGYPIPYNPPAPPSSLTSLLKESLVGGFGSGIGFSLADRAISGLFGGRTVNIVNQTPASPCEIEEKKLVECHRRSSYECTDEIAAVYKCNMEKDSKAI